MFFKHITAFASLLILAACCHASPLQVKKVQLQSTKTFLQAAHDGDLQQMQRLLTQGANAAALDESGENALVWAVVGGQARSVDFLLRHGVSAKDKNGVEALFTAIDEGQVSIVELLLNHGANVNAKDKPSDNATPIMIACFYDPGEDNAFGQSADIVRLLLARKADVNAKDRHGRTALMYLKNKPNAQIYKMLLNAGARE